MGELIILSQVRLVRAKLVELETDIKLAELQAFVRAWREAFPVEHAVFNTADLDDLLLEADLFHSKAVQILEEVR